MSRDVHREAASGRPNEHNDDLTWLDYLRTAGASVHDTRPAPPDRRESRDSTDRKRRHTGSEPEGRTYPYPTTYMRGPSDTSSSIHNPPRGGVVMQSGSSRDTPIDLTSSPARPVRPSYSRMQSSDDSRASGDSIMTRFRRRESDIVLPRWQPDNEVTKCPVCETEFSLLYRRHHCRKCGRVVCNRCSPHRITIPRQYIVQPPNPYLLEDDALASPPGRANSALGGGDTVRVCNPCVPDPWMPHTNNAASAPIAPVPPIPNMPANNHTPSFGPFGQDPRIMTLPPNQRPIGAFSAPNSDPVARSRSNTHQPTGMSNAERSLAATRSIPPISTRYHGHRYSQSSGAGPVNYFIGHGHPRPTPTSNDRSRDTVPSNSFGLTFNHVDPSRDPRLQNTAAMAPPIPQQSRPRRQVREEDECPVCGEELPPGDDIREAHVQECILTRFSSSPTRSAAIPALPDLSDSTPEGSRPRTNSFRPRGMYKSKATEKDCLGADGEPQECIICFEEFEPGDDLGTMECWCKFHRDCIRGWWEKKVAGSCPTHRLYD